MGIIKTTLVETFHCLFIKRFLKSMGNIFLWWYRRQNNKILCVFPLNLKYWFIIDLDLLKSSGFVESILALSWQSQCCKFSSLNYKNPYPSSCFFPKLDLSNFRNWSNALSILHNFIVLCHYVPYEKKYKLYKKV